MILINNRSDDRSAESLKPGAGREVQFVHSEPAHPETAPAAKFAWLDFAMFCLIAVWILWGIGSYGLYEPHEAQYAGGADEMVQRNDWVTPYLNGAPELNKPPLFYWLIAISFKLLSFSGLQPEFIARLPLALICLGGTVLAWHWAKDLWGQRAGRYAALMLAVSSGWHIFAHQLLIDELLSVSYLASLYLLWKAIHARQSTWRWAFFYTVLGLAVLAKGLPGLVFPSLALGAFIAIRRDWSLLRHCRPFLGMAIVCAIVGPWAWLFELHNPGALEYMIVNEHFRRAFDQRVPNDYGIMKVGAATFVLLTALWCAPWSLWLPQVVAMYSRKDSNARPVSQDSILLLKIGAILPVAFFLLIPSRLIYYGLPAVPPFAILCSGFWSTPVHWMGWRRKLATGSAALVGLTLLGVANLPSNWYAAIPQIAATPELLKDIPIMAFILAMGLISCGLLLNYRKEHIAFVVLLVITASVEVFDVNDFVACDATFSSKRLVKTLAPAFKDDCIWVSEGSREVGASAGFSFYLRHSSSVKSSNVLIMSDDARRPPPSYPGPAPKYLIDHEQLEKLWTSQVPVLFITDFQRTDMAADKPWLPSTDCRFVPLSMGGRPVGGNRRVYANSLAWKRLESAGLTQGETASNKTTRCPRNLLLPFFPTQD